jgi:hypothetical protein
MSARRGSLSRRMCTSCTSSRCALRGACRAPEPLARTLIVFHQAVHRHDLLERGRQGQGPFDRCDGKEGALNERSRVLLSTIQHEIFYLLISLSCVPYDSQGGATIKPEITTRSSSS